MPQDPELRRGGLAVDVIDTKAQSPKFGGEADQRRNKLREVLRWLPTRSVDRLVIDDSLADARGMGEEGFGQVAAALPPAPLAALRVAQFRGSRGDVIGKAQRRRILVPRRRMKCAFDKQPGAAEGLHGAAIARLLRVELGEPEAIPARPFDKNFCKDRIEPGIEISSRAAQDVVFDAIGIAQADQLSP